MLSVLSLLIFVVNKCKNFSAALSSALCDGLCSHFSGCLADVDDGLWFKNTCLEHEQASVLVCRYWFMVVNNRILSFK